MALNSMQYYIMENDRQWCWTYSGPDMVELGRVCGAACMKPISIMFCKDSIKMYGYGMGAFDLGGDIGKAIIINEDYRNRWIKKPDYFYTYVMHEVGHIVNGDFDEVDLKDVNDIKRERDRFLFSGAIDPNEIAADRFAAEQCGKDLVIHALKDSVKKRKQRGDSGTPEAIWELEMRIKALQEET